MAEVLVLGFAVSGILRVLIFNWLRRNREGLAGPVDLKPATHLIVDLGLWVLATAIVGTWNFWYFGFLLESGLKVVLGCITIGIFSSAYLALDAEHDLITSLSEAGNLEELRTQKFFSITTKFMVFVGASLVMISAVVLLLIYKDFTYVISELTRGKPLNSPGLSERCYSCSRCCYWVVLLSPGDTAEIGGLCLTSN